MAGRDVEVRRVLALDISPQAAQYGCREYGEEFRSFRGCRLRIDVHGGFRHGLDCEDDDGGDEYNRHHDSRDGEQISPRGLRPQAARQPWLRSRIAVTILRRRVRCLRVPSRCHDLSSPDRISHHRRIKAARGQSTENSIRERGGICTASASITATANALHVNPGGYMIRVLWPPRDPPRSCHREVASSTTSLHHPLASSMSRGFHLRGVPCDDIEGTAPLA